MARKQPVQLSLIPHEIQSNIVTQRAVDGYINATAMCKAAGREFSEYKRNKATIAFIDALSAELGISQDGLIQSIVGGVPEYQGTWIHPQVAIHLAQWLSPQFAVQVSKWVFEWLSGGGKDTMPYHLRRYIANRGNIPHTHFSILNEVIFGLVAPLESQGYTLPEKLVPDISEGKMFSSWLISKGIDPKKFPRYYHRYEDGRVVDARLYPNEVLAEFRQHFNEVWLPERSKLYFQERDPEALPYLEQVLIAIGYNKPKQLN